MISEIGEKKQMKDDDVMMKLAEAEVRTWLLRLLFWESETE